jgi:hypothetical protein
VTLIEAIKSGKRFKRTSWYSWHTTEIKVSLSFEEILADDWEVEPTPVTITREQFDAAWREAVRNSGGYDIVYGGFQKFSDLVARELGL